MAVRRMRAARILVAGARALSAEVCKNIVLAGMGKLVLCDHESVTPADMYGQFLVGESDIGKNVCGFLAPKFRYSFQSSPLQQASEKHVHRQTVFKDYLRRRRVINSSTTYPLFRYRTV